MKLIFLNLNLSNFINLKLPLVLFGNVFENMAAYLLRFLGSVPCFYFYPDFTFSLVSIDPLLLSCDLISKHFTSARVLYWKGGFAGQSWGSTGPEHSQLRTISVLLLQCELLSCCCSWWTPQACKWMSVLILKFSVHQLFHCFLLLSLS